MKKILILFLFVFIYSIYGQNDDPSKLTLEKLITKSEYRQKSVGKMQWLNGGKSYTKLENSESIENAKDIVEYNTVSGEREVLVSAEKLIPAGLEEPLSIYSYDILSEYNKILIFTNTKKVWRYNTRGDYWLLDLSNNQLKQLGAGKEESSLMFATLSPDGKFVAYVSEHNIYVENLESGKITPLTDSGSETIINGTFDWVYEEELSLRNGFRWSPDSKKIAFWQLDASGIGVYNMINYTDSIYSKIIPVQYPKVGTTNSACKIGVINIDGTNLKWMNIEGDPRQNYLARMEWASSNDEIGIQQFNREQNKVNILLANVNTGNVKNIYTEESGSWIDVCDDMIWFDDGNQFTWLSEKGDWRSLYVISRDGNSVELANKIDFDIISIVSINANGNYYFTASPDNATQVYLYQANFIDKTAPQRISPMEMSGTHRYQISPDNSFSIHRFSNSSTPEITDIISLPEHKTVRVLENNEKLAEKVSQLDISPREFFTIKLNDGTELDAYKILPPNFDGNKKYPVLFHIYGEPAAQTVLDYWASDDYLYHQFLAQHGYIIMSIDNRGTPGPKGTKFRKSVYKKVGTLAAVDQAEAARQILSLPYVDTSKIGIWGWSGGGSMSLNCIFRYPEIYKLAMAIASVADERLYDTIYQERYMGLLSENLDEYIEGSAINYAKNLKGDLLLIHGTGDDNVHYQNTEILINELIKQNKMFTAVPYPNRTHSIYRGENTRRHLYETLTWFLMKNMPPNE